MATVWFVLAVGSERQHGSNDGYDDDPARHYRWDSTVPQHANLAAGDVIGLWDKKQLLGVSVIERIDTDHATKTTYFHDTCGKADFKPLKTGELKWWCNKCRTRFEKPQPRTREVVTYCSHHGRAWQSLPGRLTGDQVRRLCDKPTSQHSMRPARWEKVHAALDEAGASLPARVTDKAKTVIRGGHRQATVEVRQGQETFRKQLLHEQGENCAFSGPTPAEALEAAHLYSFAESGEHHEFGGLMMRRDLHRLFDLGHIAVDPDTGILDVGKKPRDYPLYRQLHGQTIRVPLQPQHRVWLGAHWDRHRAKP
ncbi:HNH endonuclease [Streptomyces sioyaensis]|uniref:HNH endonuclease n=1 Tax=Streptomyces sioyaensis TaxID=67364 RepID=A0A4Q1QUM9_9ACTN|nr:HNH endonuclease signature motif containing protein [Streptomyces sioyaensis]MBM4794613.1 HNH endonuclease [Streptomyces sioyaensis]RXS62268.1 HNH endonuclease [Streptomyces sioyaensis]